MIYHHQTNTGHKLVITFRYSEYPDIVEPSVEDGKYFLTQDVKSWLVKNNIKVFVKYDSTATDVEFFIKFEDPSDALMFITKYGKTTEE